MISRSGSLAAKHPDIAKEWHPTKNASMTPFDVSPHSGRRVWWLCPKGHEWEVSVNQRTRGEGTWCPKCNPQVSKLEIALYCELKSVFRAVGWHTKISGVECDIFIEPLQLVLELDGYPWHKGHEHRDREKNNLLELNGIKVLRVRDKRLNRISPIDVLYDGRSHSFPIVKAVLRTLLKHNLCPPQLQPEVYRYLRVATVQNESEYKRILSLLPGPPYEHSLAHLRPDLVQQWHTEKNQPLTPSYFTIGSGQKVWWVCCLGHEYRATICDRATKGRGCPVCAQTSKGQTYKKLAVISAGSLADRNPSLATEWHPNKNANLTPRDRSPGSQDKVWWLCTKGHEWKASIVSRSRGNGCPICFRLRRKQKRMENLAK